MAKRLTHSKMFWINIIALSALVVQAFTGQIISTNEQLAILAVINLILRLVTREPIEGL